jgi:hypothetical protein
LASYKLGESFVDFTKMDKLYLKDFINESSAKAKARRLQFTSAPD